MLVVSGQLTAGVPWESWAVDYEQHSIVLSSRETGCCFFLRRL